MYDEIKEQARAAMQELLELAAPKPSWTPSIRS